MSSTPLVTQLLSSWREGDEKALEALTPVIYETLRRLSSKQISQEKNPTIQATELVHEAYLQLIDTDIDWQDRAHFFAVASRLMRRLLIDRARARLRQKRGAGMALSSQNLSQIAEPEIERTLLELNDALKKLSTLDKRKADALELHYFGGMTYPEIAVALNVSEATIDRDLRFAKAWLCNEIKQEL